MMGRKAPVGKLFYQVSLEELVPEGHLLRRVAEAVDFAVARRLTSRFYSRTGQPSVDPVVLFKMALLGYLYGIPSERRLAEEIRLNLAYRWFIGYDLDEAIPDHSVLSKARRRFGPTVYEAFFTDVVRQCERVGLIRGDQLFMDSTLVAAHADLDRVGSRALIRQLPAVGEHVADLWAEDEVAPAPGGEPAASGRAPLHPAGPDDPPNKRVGLLNERLVSRTDPDAAVVQRSGVPADLYYKVHVGVDGGSARIITAVVATGGAVADEHLLPRLVADHEGNTGRAARAVAADTKYGTVDNYRWLEARGILAAIPFAEANSDSRAVPRSAFAYDPEADTYRCPNGATLRNHGRTTTLAAHPLIIYRARPKDCAACPLKQRCCGSAQVRSLSRPDDGGLRVRTAAYLGTPRARRLIARRKAWAETVFGDGKERRALRRARCRGIDEMRIQALLTATAQNARQLALRRRRGPIERGATVRPTGTRGRCSLRPAGARPVPIRGTAQPAGVRRDTCPGEDQLPRRNTAPR